MSFLKVAQENFRLPWQQGASKNQRILALKGFRFISLRSAQGAGLASGWGWGRWTCRFKVLPRIGRQRGFQEARAAVWEAPGPSLGQLLFPFSSIASKPAYKQEVWEGQRGEAGRGIPPQPPAGGPRPHLRLEPTRAALGSQRFAGTSQGLCQGLV